MRTFLVLVFGLLSSHAAAQTGGSALSDRINSVDPATTTEADCDAQVEQAENLNGPDLLFGAAICFAANKPVEGGFLLNAGQTRSIADMSLMVPAARADSDVQTELYGFIYFSAGGPGSDEVLRQSPLRDRLFSLLDGWSPHYSLGYNPGWNVRRRPDAEAYASAIDELEAGRRQQLADLGRLYSDDIYFALHRRLQELQARTSGTYVEGTPGARMSEDLQRQMSERARDLGIASGIRNETPDEELGDLSNDQFPPAAPAPDEVVQSSSDDPSVQNCVDAAERLTIAAGSHVARVLITQSPEWGTIWRADFEGGFQGPVRFTCTARTSSSQPMDMPGESVSPLPESGFPRPMP